MYPKPPSRARARVTTTGPSTPAFWAIQRMGSSRALRRTLTPAPCSPVAACRLSSAPWHRSSATPPPATTPSSTAELVAMIRRAAAEVARRHPGGVLGVCDLSAARGGFVAGHRSHQSGRDVDLQFYALDAAGRSLVPDATLARFDRRGEARGASHPRWQAIPLRRLDTARTWALVRAMLADPRVVVQHVFVSWSIRRLLLARARLEDDTGEVYRRAARVLRRPTGGRLHNDHLHVRIACPGGDGTRGGCRNAPAPRRARPWRWRVRCPVKTGSPLAGVRRGR